MTNIENFARVPSHITISVFVQNYEAKGFHLMAHFCVHRTNSVKQGSLYQLQKYANNVLMV